MLRLPTGFLPTNFLPARFIQTSVFFLYERLGERERFPLFRVSEIERPINTVIIIIMMMMMMIIMIMIINISVFFGFFTLL